GGSRRGGSRSARARTDVGPQGGVEGEPGFTTKKNGVAFDARCIGEVVAFAGASVPATAQFPGGCSTSLAFPLTSSTAPCEGMTQAYRAGNRTCSVALCGGIHAHALRKDLRPHQTKRSRDSDSAPKHGTHRVGCSGWCDRHLAVDTHWVSCLGTGSSGSHL